MVKKADQNDAGGKRWVKVPGSALADPWAPTSKSDVIAVANWVVKDCRRVATGGPTSCVDGAPLLMGNTPEGVVFTIGEELTIKQWHHEPGDATSGHFSCEHRLVQLRAEQVGVQMMGFLADSVRALEPDGDFFNYQVVGHGAAFVPWLHNTGAYEWRASLRVKRPALAGGEDVVVVAWKPNANGTASQAVCVAGRGPTRDPGVVGIANARQALYGGRGWAGNRSHARGRGRGLRGDEAPWPPFEQAAAQPALPLAESAPAEPQASDDGGTTVGFWNAGGRWRSGAWNAEGWWRSGAWSSTDSPWVADGGAGGGAGSAGAGSASSAGPAAGNPWGDLS